MLDTLTPGSFAEHVGSRFHLQLDGQEPLELELFEISRYEENPEHAARKEPFSLMFIGPVRPVLPQAIYPLEHPVVGKLEIFLVPIGPDPRGKQSGMRYEAAFN
ncbi:MAG TPA: hypothetical protein VFR31_20475 [Thermoanaerobaculia bacterium]|nr:hypothetical protein [Thermoanaerobaculia bacterium]